MSRSIGLAHAGDKITCSPNTIRGKEIWLECIQGKKDSQGARSL